MKKILVILTLIFCFAALANTDVTFNLTDPQYGISQTTNATVTVQAENISQSGSVTLLPLIIQKVTGTNGSVTFSNIFGSSISGFYHWTVAIYNSSKRVTGDMWVQSTNMGSVSEGQIDIVNGAPTYPAGTWAWSAQASDIRYGPSTNSLLNYSTTVQLNSASNTLFLLIPSTNGFIGLNAGATNQWKLDATNAARSFAESLTNLNANTSNSIYGAIQSTGGATTNYVNTATNVLNVSLSNLVARATNDLNTSFTNTMTITSNSLRLAYIALNSATFISNSNLSYSIGLNGTNFSRAQSLLSTNFSIAQSNLIWTALLASTNGSLQAATNFAKAYALIIGGNDTNFARGTIGQAGTNNVLAVSNSIYSIMVLQLGATNTVVMAAITASGTSVSNGAVAFARLVGGAATNAIINASNSVYSNVKVFTNNFPLSNLDQQPLTNHASYVVYLDGGLQNNRDAFFGSFSDFILENGDYAFGHQTLTGGADGILNTTGGFVTLGNVTGVQFFGDASQMNLGSGLTNKWRSDISSTNFATLVSLTNFLATKVNGTNGVAYGLTVNSNVNFSPGFATMLINTNLIGVSGFDQRFVDGSYVRQVSGTYTNNVSNSNTLFYNGGNWYLQSNGVSLFALAGITPVGNSWTLVNGIGTIGQTTYGVTFNANGWNIAGTPLFAKMMAIIQSLVSSGAITNNASYAITLTNTNNSFYGTFTGIFVGTNTINATNANYLGGVYYTAYMQTNTPLYLSQIRTNGGQANWHLVWDTTGGLWQTNTGGAGSFSGTATNLDGAATNQVNNIAFDYSQHATNDLVPYILTIGGFGTNYSKNVIGLNATNNDLALGLLQSNNVANVSNVVGMAVQNGTNGSATYARQIGNASTNMTINTSNSLYSAISSSSPSNVVFSMNGKGTNTTLINLIGITNSGTLGFVALGIVMLSPPPYTCGTYGAYDINSPFKSGDAGGCGFGSMLPCGTTNPIQFFKQSGGSTGGTVAWCNGTTNIGILTVGFHYNSQTGGGGGTVNMNLFYNGVFLIGFTNTSSGGGDSSNHVFTIDGVSGESVFTVQATTANATYDLVLTNTFLAYVTNASATSLSINTTSPGTNALKVIGNGDFSSLSISGVPINTTTVVSNVVNNISITDLGLGFLAATNINASGAVAPMTILNGDYQYSFTNTVSGRVSGWMTNTANTNSFLVFANYTNGFGSYYLTTNLTTPTTGFYYSRYSLFGVYEAQGGAPATNPIVQYVTSGLGLTAAQAAIQISTNNVENVNNIMKFGASGNTNWVLDTAAMNAAIRAAAYTNGFDVFVPAGSYGWSNVIYDGTPLNFLTNTASFSGWKIRGNFGFTRLYPVNTTAPILTLTNAINNVILENLSFYGNGKVVVSAPMLVLDGPSGSIDGSKAVNCFFQNASIPFKARAFSDSHFDHCSINNNDIAGWFDTAPGEGNNNVYFQGGFIGANNKGFIANTGQFEMMNIEGGNDQTNMFLCTNASSVFVNVQGGNYELGNGSYVTTSNKGAVHFTIQGARVVQGTGHTGAKLVAFEDDGTSGSYVDVWNDNQIELAVKIGGAYSGTPLMVDHGANSSVQVERSGSYTNYMGLFRTAGTFNTSPGNADYNYNNFVNLRNDGSASNYNSLYYGAFSNSAIHQVDVLDFWKDKRNLARINAANSWNSTATKITGLSALNGYDYGWGLDPAGSGRAVRFGMGQVGYNEWFISSASSAGGIPDHYNIYFDTAGNAMTVYGSLTVTGAITGASFPAASLTGTVADAQLGSAAPTNRANTFTAAQTVPSLNVGVWTIRTNTLNGALMLTNLHGGFLTIGTNLAALTNSGPFSFANGNLTSDSSGIIYGLGGLSLGALAGTPVAGQIKLAATANNTALRIAGNTTSGQNFGQLIIAGSTSADYGFKVQAGGAAGIDHFMVRGDGLSLFGASISAPTNIAPFYFPANNTNQVLVDTAYSTGAQRFRIQGSAVLNPTLTAAAGVVLWVTNSGGAWFRLPITAGGGVTLVAAEERPFCYDLNSNCQFKVSSVVSGAATAYLTNTVLIGQ